NWNIIKKEGKLGIDVKLNSKSGNTGSSIIGASSGSMSGFGALMAGLNFFNMIMMAFGNIKNLLQKLVQPFEKSNAILNDQLAQADNISTRAAQYNTSAQKYYASQKVLNTFDIQESSLDMMLKHFRERLGEAKLADQKGEKTLLSNYIGETDTLQAFWDFIDYLQNLKDKDVRDKLAGDILGSREEKVLGELLGSNKTDMQEIFQRLFKGVNFEKLGSEIDRMGIIQGEQAALAARRDIENMNNRAKYINSKNVNKQNKFEKTKDQVNTQNMKFYGNYVDMMIMLEKMNKISSDALNGILKSVTDIVNGGNETKKQVNELVKVVNPIQTLNQIAQRLFSKSNVNNFPNN
ncbi:MAG: hypothetical protein LBF97_06360, partial [Elusimicrobiota bacterium]|nr:hypothetical protein [Elusimicrobiota bacterium]